MTISEVECGTYVDRDRTFSTLQNVNVDVVEIDLFVLVTFDNTEGGFLYCAFNVCRIVFFNQTDLDNSNNNNSNNK